MTLPVDLRAEAEGEFLDAASDMEQHRPGSGQRFISAVEEVLSRLSRTPKAHQVIFADIRRAVVRRFPYCVFYRAHLDRVEVIAIVHGKRDPGVWQKRV